MKLSLIAAISIDGFMADRNVVGWSSEEDRAFFIEETKRVGAVITGRINFDTFPGPLEQRYNVVMTRNPQPSAESVWYTDASPEEVIADLEAKGYTGASVIGGAQINTLYMESGLVTDLYLTLRPYLYGKGIPLFADMNNQYTTELISSKPLGPGEILNHYKVIS